MLLLSSLQIGYEGKPLVSLPPLTLTPGMSCLVRGPSGSGKTTLLHTLAGLQPPIAGSVSLNTTDIYSLNESARDHFRGRHISIIFQTLHLINHLTVMQNLLLAATASGQAQDRRMAAALLKDLDIENLSSRKASTLSRGQSQRVAIARALLTRPSLILADEPTSSLDDTACDQTLSLLKNLTRSTNAILVVTSHDSRIFDRFDQTCTLGA